MSEKKTSGSRASKKTTAKKAAAKKPTTKTAATKKPAAKKSSAYKKPAGTTLAQLQRVATDLRRPDPNLPPDVETIKIITITVLQLITYLEDYAANLRALDRQRHNGVGIRRLGFIEAALRISSMFPQYFPHWLNTKKFQNDLDLFTSMRSLLEACRSLDEKVWNISVEASDMVYTDALEYYSQVQDAARRRVDSAETIYKELHDFFRHVTRQDESAAPTEKQLKRDVSALLHGKKDGEVIIKNVRPSVSGGAHEVIDETFKDRASFKATEEGEIEE